MYHVPGAKTRRLTLGLYALIIAALALSSCASPSGEPPATPPPPPPAPSGSLDTAFGPDGTGLVTLDFGGEDDDYLSRAKAIAVQNDGKIVAAGSALGWFTDIAVARFLSDGNLDEDFGDAGVFREEIVFSGFDINDIAIQGDGKIVLAGYYGGRSDSFMLIRLKPEGALDEAFGSGGFVKISMGGPTTNSRAMAMAIHEPSAGECKIIAAGWASPGFSHRDLAVARFNADGSLDTSFNGIGYATTDVATGSQDEVLDIAVLPDGSIAAAGKSGSDIVIARYEADGTLDTDFGSNGLLVESIGTEADRAHSIAIRPDGKILVAGNADDNDHLFIASFSALGAPDAAFGTAGVASTSFEGLSGEDGAIVLQEDGKLIYAGHATIGESKDFIIARYGLDGALDEDFGENGIVSTAIGIADDIACAVSIQPSDGKILAAGYSSLSASVNLFAIARYHP